MRVTYHLDSTGYQLALVCGIAGVWAESELPGSPGLCWDNPSEEIVSIVCIFHPTIEEVYVLA